MRERLEIRTKTELKEHLGFIILCFPDRFPTDEDAEFLPQNAEEAFEDIDLALDALRPGSRGGLAEHERLLVLAADAKRSHTDGDTSECLRLLQELRFSLMGPGSSPGSSAPAASSPREQGNQLLNEVIHVSQQIIERDGSHIPFAKALKENGEIETILVDDSDTQDPDVLIDTLATAIRQRTDLVAVAFATNVDYQEIADGPRVDAIMIDIDHKGDRPITCVLPYARRATGELALGELFAIEARRTFFATKDKIRPVK